GKYFVSVNLPELPSGVYWDGTIAVFDKQDSYMYSSGRNDIRLKTGLVKIEIEGLTDANIKNLGIASLGLRVFNEKGDMVMHSISTDGPNKVLRESTVQTDDTSIEAFNTTGIFNWN
ncbi:hypothetical protein IZY60_15125, partial [Lutibacter sp. B2]|nr:hypothetical protein [Lutibacter sp. B2]